MILTDCTDTLRLVYDRGKDGYGVPVPGVRFKGTSKLGGVLLDVRDDLKSKDIGWWDSIESVLTAGLYVDKKGAHGDGIAWDFDGVVLKPNVFDDPADRVKVFLYKNGVQRNPVNSEYIYSSLTPKTKTRFACLLSLRFGVVLTAGYKSKDGKYHHEDHIHADLARTVKWRGSRSQVVCLQETLNAWFGAELKVDGVFGDKTKHAWGTVMWRKTGHLEEPLDAKTWLRWLALIAFNPPKDVK